MADINMNDHTGDGKLSDEALSVVERCAQEALRNYCVCDRHDEVRSLLHVVDTYKMLKGRYAGGFSDTPGGKMCAEAARQQLLTLQKNILEKQKGIGVKTCTCLSYKTFPHKEVLIMPNLRLIEEDLASDEDKPDKEALNFDVSIIALTTNMLAGLFVFHYLQSKTANSYFLFRRGVEDAQLVVEFAKAPGGEWMISMASGHTEIVSGTYFLVADFVALAYGYEASYFGHQTIVPRNFYPESKECLDILVRSVKTMRVGTKFLYYFQSQFFGQEYYGVRGDVTAVEFQWMADYLSKMHCLPSRHEILDFYSQAGRSVTYGDPAPEKKKESAKKNFLSWHPDQGEVFNVARSIFGEVSGGLDSELHSPLAFLAKGGLKYQFYRARGTIYLVYCDNVVVLINSGPPVTEDNYSEACHRLAALWCATMCCNGRAKLIGLEQHYLLYKAIKRVLPAGQKYGYGAFRFGMVRQLAYVSMWITFLREGYDTSKRKQSFCLSEMRFDALCNFESNEFQGELILAIEKDMASTCVFPSKYYHLSDVVTIVVTYGGEFRYWDEKYTDNRVVSRDCSGPELMSVLYSGKFATPDCSFSDDGGLGTFSCLGEFT